MFDWWRPNLVGGLVTGVAYQFSPCLVLGISRFYFCVSAGSRMSKLDLWREHLGTRPDAPGNDGLEEPSRLEGITNLVLLNTAHLQQRHTLMVHALTDIPIVLSHHFLLSLSLLSPPTHSPLPEPRSASRLGRHGSEQCGPWMSYQDTCTRGFILYHCVCTSLNYNATVIIVQMYYIILCYLSPPIATPS